MEKNLRKIPHGKKNKKSLYRELLKKAIELERDKTGRVIGVRKKARKNEGFRKKVIHT